MFAFNVVLKPPGESLEPFAKQSADDAYIESNRIKVWPGHYHATLAAILFCIA